MRTKSIVATFVTLCIRFGEPLDMIEIRVNSVLGQYASFQASSRSPQPEEVSTVYLPLSLSVNVDLERGNIDSFVRQSLTNADDDAIAEWKLCIAIGNRSPDCRGLLHQQSLPNLHDLILM